MTNGLTDEAIAAYAAQLLYLEADIDEMQADKKKVYTNLREAYGKRAADSLKLAIKRHRMDADKRTEADEIDAEAERFLSIIRKPSAPRATRTREIIEEFDPETGEILPNSTAVRTDAPNQNATGQSALNAGEAGTQAPPVETHPQHEAEEAGEDVVTAASSPDTQSEPAEGSPTPTSAVAGDRRTEASPAATVVPSNVTSFRTHNPETHFLNSEGLPRLHGCLKAELCGSAEPRKRLCFPCSVAHDGPTPQVEGGAA